MQPNPPVPEPKPPENPYGFILETGTGPTPDTKEAKNRRLLIVAIGGVGLLIVLVILSALIFGGSKDSAQPVVSLIQLQSETARIADLGNNKTKSPNTLRFVATVKLTTMSDQQLLMANLSKRGRKVTEKELAPKKDATVDKALETAEKNNRYDEAMVQALRAKLNSYLTSARAAIGTTKSDSQIKLLKSTIANTELLLKLDAP